MQACFGEGAHINQAKHYPGFKLGRGLGRDEKHHRLLKNLDTHQVQIHFTLHSPHILLTAVLSHKFMHSFSSLKTSEEVQAFHQQN